MTGDVQTTAEVLGFTAGVILNYGTLQQTIFCFKRRSAKGISWKSLYARSAGVCLFAASTYFYAGPISMTIGNMFSFANTMIVIAIKRKEKPLQIQILGSNSSNSSIEDSTKANSDADCDSHSRPMPDASQKGGTHDDK